MVKIETALHWFDRADLSGQLQRNAMSRQGQGTQAQAASDAWHVTQRRSDALASNFHASSGVALNVARLGSLALIPFANVAPGAFVLQAAEMTLGRGALPVAGSHPATLPPLEHILKFYDAASEHGALGLVLERVPLRLADTCAKRDCLRLASGCVLAATVGRCALQPLRLLVAVVAMWAVSIAASLVVAAALVAEGLLRIVSAVGHAVLPLSMQACDDAIDRLASPWVRPRDFVESASRSQAPRRATLAAHAFPTGEGDSPVLGEARSSRTWRVDTGEVREARRPWPAGMGLTLREALADQDDATAREVGRLWESAWHSYGPHAPSFERLAAADAYVAHALGLASSHRPPVYSQSLTASRSAESLRWPPRRPLPAAPRGTPAPAPAGLRVVLPPATPLMTSRPVALSFAGRAARRSRAQAQRVAEFDRNEFVPQATTAVATGASDSDRLAVGRMQALTLRVQHEEVKRVTNEALHRFAMQTSPFRAQAMNEEVGMLEAAQATACADQIAADLARYCARCSNPSVLRFGLSLLTDFMEVTYGDECKWSPPAAGSAR